MAATKKIVVLLALLVIAAAVTYIVLYPRLTTKKGVHVYPVKGGFLVILDEPGYVIKAVVYDAATGEEVGYVDVGARVESFTVYANVTEGCKYKVEIVGEGFKYVVLVEYSPKPLTEITSLLLASRDKIVEDGAYYNVWTWREWRAAKASIAVSPKGDLAVVVTYDGKVIAFEIPTLKKLWEFSSPGAVMTHAVFSEDGKYVIVGEQSVNGYVYCLNAKTGEVVWKFRTADDLGGSPSDYRKPKVYYISVRGGVAYFSAARVVKVVVENVTKRVAYCVIYAVDIESGKLLWRFPKSGFLDSSYVPTVKASEHYVVFAVFWSYNSSETNPWKKGTVAVLDRETGKLLARFTIPPRDPFKYTTIWRGIDIDEQHSILAVLTGDARVIVVDLEKLVEKHVMSWDELRKAGAMKWIAYVADPIQIGEGAYIYTYGNTVKILRSRYLVVLTGLTYGLGTSTKPTLVHPNATSAFILDVEGKRLIARFRLGGIPTYYNNIDVSGDGKYLLVAVGHDWISASKNSSGVYIFDVSEIDKGRVELVAEYLSEGRCVAAAFVGTQYVLECESPINMAKSSEEPADIVGDYKAVLLALKP